MNVRVGVIGAGVMGADHANTLHRKVSGAVLTAVTDVDGNRARAVADASGAAVPADGFALIDDPGVDAIIIAAHDSTHAELTLAAIAAGKPVLCEKPLAPTVPESEAVVGAERDAVGGRIPLVSVGFMRRFDPGYVQLKAAPRDGRVGPAVVLPGYSRGVSDGPGATSESSITGSAIHEFDCVPWLLDSPITEVSWHAGRQSSQVDPVLRDPQVLLLRTADGVLSTVEAFLNARYGHDVRCDVVGEHGTLALTEPTVMVADSSRTHGYDYAADWRRRFADAYRLQLQEWVDAVAGWPFRNRRPEPSAASGRPGTCRWLKSTRVSASRRSPIGPERHCREDLSDRTPAAPHRPSEGRADPAVGYLRARLDRRAVRRGDAAQHRPDRAGGRVPWRGPLRRVFRETRHRTVVRVVRGAAGRSGRRRGLCRHPAQRALPPGQAGDRCRQAHGRGKAAGASRLPGGGVAGPGRGEPGVPDGGTLDAVPAQVRRDPAAAGRRDVRRDPHGAGGSRRVLRGRPPHPAARPGRWPDARPGHLPGVVRPVRARPAGPDPGGRSAAPGRGERAGLGDPIHGPCAAVVHTTVFANTPTTGAICGTSATLSIPGPFYQPGPMTLASVSGAALNYDEPATAHEGLFFEAVEAARCIVDGRIESPLRPVADSIATLRTMDEMRRQIGQVFDEER